MRRSVFIISVLMLFYTPCIAQMTNAVSNVSIERAQALSNMASFYGTSGNYDRAIELERQSMDIIANLCGNESLEYATASLKIANYYHSNGCHTDSESNMNNQLAVKYLKTAMDIIRDDMLGNFNEMSTEDKYSQWSRLGSLYDRVFPCYVALCQNDSTISDLYNTVLFSKGITWRNYRNAVISDWRNIQKRLRKRDLAIEFISPVNLEGNNITFYALVLGKSYCAPHMIKLFDIMQLQGLLEKVSSQYERDMKIGRLIWGHLEKELTGMENIFFSATHVLHNMAIEFFPMDEANFYCDKYNFYRLSSTAELKKEFQPSQYYKAVLYGGLDYGATINNDQETQHSKVRSGWEPLYNTTTEVLEISKLLQNKGTICISYLDTYGTEASFRDLSGKDFDILHMATHGQYTRLSDSSELDIDRGNSLEHTCLALSGANIRLHKTQIKDDEDGLITALDISKMDLNPVNLVCLSACDTALGVYSDDDGILGLQCGFKEAGVQTILMSVTKVDDEATRILMVEFYRNLMSGKTKHQSLKDAQRYLRTVDNGKYDKPEYWASFIMLDGLN